MDSLSAVGARARLRASPALFAIFLSIICTGRGNRNTYLFRSISVMFSLMCRADTMHRQIPQVSIPLSTEPHCTYISVGSFVPTWKHEGRLWQELTCCLVCTQQQGFPEVHPMSCLGDTGLSWPSFLALLLPRLLLLLSSYMCFILRSSLSCLPHCPFPVYTLLRNLFTTINILIPFPVQTVIPSCHSPHEEPVVPSSPSF